MNDLKEIPALDREVEAQLDEVMETIERGASPWLFEDRDLAELRDHYRPGFEAQKKTWSAARVKILRLAKYQGALAAFFAEVQHNNVSEPKGKIPRSCLWLASFLVQLACPFYRDADSGKKGIGPVGPHCPKIKQEALDTSLARGLLTHIIELDPDTRAFGEGLLQQNE